MTIFSPATEYTVLTRVHGGERRLVARDYAGNTRLLVTVNDAEEIEKLLPKLIEWKEDTAFTDLIEFFPAGGGLVAVFAYHADGLPPDKALNRAPNMLRAAVLRSLFARILLQNTPREILNEALTAGNLYVSRAGRVRLMYDLPRDGNASLSSAAKLIAGAENAVVPEIADFIKNLADDKYESYVQIYAAACEAAAVLETRSEDKPEITPVITVIRERIRFTLAALQEKWKLLLAVTALLAGYAAVGLLFYSTVIAPSGVDNGIRAIGTVMVGDGG